MQKERFVGLLNGIDISKYQESATKKINWSVLRRPPGFPENLFCLIRAGGAYTLQGTYTDRSFETSAAAAPVYFPYVGFYWFFVPRGGVEFAKKQASLFWELVKNKEWNWLAVDVESQPWGYKVSRQEFQSTLRAFLEELTKLSGGAMAWVYTRASFWNHYVGNPTWAGRYPLHVARYHNSLNSPWGDGYYRALPWADQQPNDDWKGVMWQHSADDNGLGSTFGVASGDIDRDAFNGTVEEFENLLATYGRFEKEDDPPPVTDCDKDVALLKAAILEMKVEQVKLKNLISDVELELENHEHESVETSIRVYVTRDKTLARYSSGNNANGFPKIANNIHEPRLKWENGDVIRIKSLKTITADGGSEWYILEHGQSSVFNHTVPPTPTLYIRASDVSVL